MIKLPFTLPTVLAIVALLGIATCDPCEPCDPPQETGLTISLDTSPDSVGDAIPAS